MTPPSAPSRAASELEIRNVLARLAQLADSGSTAEYVQLLTDDIVWAMPANPTIDLPASERRGHDEIAAGQRERIAAGLQGVGSNTMHTVTTTSITFSSDELATARSSFVFWTSTATSPTATSMGRYVDTFVATDAGWKLARREITFA
jgi:3-phenylpropionate/cinnamic acid dioxygenase small subunit